MQQRLSQESTVVCADINQVSDMKFKGETREVIYSTWTAVPYCLYAKETLVLAFVSDPKGKSYVHTAHDSCSTAEIGKIKAVTDLFQPCLSTTRVVSLDRVETVPQETSQSLMVSILSGLHEQNY